jgi:hypothetical protein
MSEDHSNPLEYSSTLAAFDAAVCEASAAGQAQAARMAEPIIGYGTRVYARICALANSMIRLMPQSRWNCSNFEFWDFGSVAGLLKGILSGASLFLYLTERGLSDEEASARVNLIHLNDCTQRIHLYSGKSPEEIQGFRQQQLELRKRLLANSWFRALPDTDQARYLSGEYLTFEMTAESPLDGFLLLVDEQINIGPLSFHWIEANGRGTGIANDTDRGYLAIAMDLATTALNGCTDRLTEIFPDTSGVRKGTSSKFSPGPEENAPLFASADRLKLKPSSSQMTSRKDVQPEHWFPRHALLLICAWLIVGGTLMFLMSVSKELSEWLSQKQYLSGWVQAVGGVVAIVATGGVATYQGVLVRRLEFARRSSEEVQKLEVVLALVVRSYGLANDVLKAFESLQDTDFEHVSPPFMLDTQKSLNALPIFEIPAGLLALDVLSIGRSLGVLVDLWRDFTDEHRKTGSYEGSAARELKQFAEEIRSVSSAAMKDCKSLIAKRKSQLS